MASNTTTTQRATTASPSPDIQSKNPTKKNTTESPNTIRNLGKFSPYYALFIWSVLVTTLVWNDRLSLEYLLSVTKVSFFYLGMFLLLPEFVILLRMAVDKIFVWFIILAMLLFLFIATLFELAVMQGEMVLFWALASTVPIILLHASLSKGEELFVDVETAGVSLIVQEKGTSDDLPENLV